MKQKQKNKKQKQKTKTKKNKQKKNTQTNKQTKQNKTKNHLKIKIKLSFFPYKHDKGKNYENNGETKITKFRPIVCKKLFILLKATQMGCL